MSPEGSALPDHSGGSFRLREQWLGLVIPFLLCFYLIFTSTVSVFPSISVWDTKRCAEFILLTIGFLIAIGNPLLRRDFTYQLSRIRTFAGVIICLFFALGIVSAIVNHDSPRGLVYSLVDVLLLILLFVMAVVIAACRNIAGQHFDRMAISFLTLLGLAVGIQEIAGYWALWSLGYTFSFDTALIHFSFPRMYNHLQTWTIPLLPVLPLLFYRSRLASVVCIVALGLHWNILLLTGARGSTVSLLVAFAMASIINPTARRLIFKWQSAGMVLGILLYAAMFTGTEFSKDRILVQYSVADEVAAASERHSALEGDEADEEEPNAFLDLSIGRPMLHTTGRTGLWKSAIKYAQDNPLLGIGPMNFACKGPKGRVGSPHNIVFLILSEWGIPAAFILVMLGLFVLWHLFRALRADLEATDTPGVIRVLLITAILAVMVQLSVDSLLIAPASQVAAALIGGWLLAVFPRSVTSSRSHAAVAVLSLALLCSTLLLPFAYHEMTRMPSYLEQLPDVEQGRPRLWELGKACSSFVH